MNKLNYRQIFLICGLFAALCSCNDLNVPPMDKITDDDVFTTDTRVDAYFARLYADMPILQFASGSLGGNTTYGFTGELITGAESVSGGDKLDAWTSGGYANRGKVWDYIPIHDQCYFLQVFPKYASLYDEKKVNTWTAEVYFLRAFRYFEMVKRYGGVPIIKSVLDYPNVSLVDVTKARDKEKDCYDFIIEDLDKSIDLFTRGIAGYKIKGRVNVWTAQALKARVALYAASLANFGQQDIDRYKNYKNGLIGIPNSEATRYYNLAWSAAKAVIDSKQHRLYEGLIGDGSYYNKINNFVYIFLADKTEVSPETLLAVHHSTASNGVAFANNLMPAQYKGGGSGSKEYIGAPALDIVKMYEDTDGNSYEDILDGLLGTDVNPVYYDNPLDLFDNATVKAEPRMRASILVPGENTFRKETTPDNYVLDVLYGILPAGKLPSERILEEVKTSNDFTHYYTVGADSMAIAGKSGNGMNGTRTGFYLRKSHDPTLTRENIVFGTSGQMPWVEMRYAEVLLTAAEAAVELNDGAKKAEAAEYVNMIRQRAGAFNKNYNASSLTRKVVQNEWQKEFYFENTIYWNLIRWREFHKQINNKSWGAVYPIYVWDKKQYYMKKHAVDNNTSTFRDQYYYMEIPGDARNRNQLLERNYD